MRGRGAGFAFRGRVFWVSSILSFLLLSFFAAPNTPAQRRDHLTKEEVELIRDVQEVDGRMEIFVRAIDRRLIAISGTSGLDKDQLKRLEKEKEKWGELPEGTRSQLLSDIDKILDEAIDKLEDVSERDAKNELFAYAVYVLADYAKVLTGKLEALRDNSADPRDIAVLNSSIGQCGDIIEASSKVERPEPKTKKKKEKN